MSSLKVSGRSGNGCVSAFPTLPDPIRSQPFPTLAFPTLPHPSRTYRQLIDETMSRDRIEEPLLVRVLYTKFFVQRGEVWECFSRSLSWVSRSGKGREGLGRVGKLYFVEPQPFPTLPNPSQTPFPDLEKFNEPSNYVANKFNSEGSETILIYWKWKL